MQKEIQGGSDSGLVVDEVVGLEESILHPLRAVHRIIGQTFVPEGFKKKEDESDSSDSELWLPTSVLSESSRITLKSARERVFDHFKRLFEENPKKRKIDIEGEEAHETANANVEVRLNNALLERIPSLNSRLGAAFEVSEKSERLVRFRGMVQDIFDPEIHLALFKRKKQTSPGGVAQEGAAIVDFMDRLPAALLNDEEGEDSNNNGMLMDFAPDTTSLPADRIPM
jgi:hypothetical protein